MRETSKLMDTIQLFLLHHYRLHFGPSGLQGRIEGLSEKQMKLCPYGLNSIAWILWHISRCEDVGINRIVCDLSQVFEEENWATKLNVFRKDIGTSMTQDEVSKLTSDIEINFLRKYYMAVALRTQKVIQDINSSELDKIPEDKYLQKVLFDEQALCETNKWVSDHYSKKNKAWFLGHLGLTHGFGHQGHIIFIRKLQGLGGGGN